MYHEAHTTLVGMVGGYPAYHTGGYGGYTALPTMPGMPPWVYHGQHPSILTELVSGAPVLVGLRRGSGLSPEESPGWEALPVLKSVKV